MGEEIEMRPAFTSASTSADDLVLLLFLGVFVDQSDDRTEFRGFAGEL